MDSGPTAWGSVVPPCEGKTDRTGKRSSKKPELERHGRNVRLHAFAGPRRSIIWPSSVHALRRSLGASVACGNISSLESLIAEKILLLEVLLKVMKTIYLQSYFFLGLPRNRSRVVVFLHLEYNYFP